MRRRRISKAVLVREHARHSLERPSVYFCPKDLKRKIEGVLCGLLRLCLPGHVQVVEIKAPDPDMAKLQHALERWGSAEAALFRLSRNDVSACVNASTKQRCIGERPLGSQTLG